LTTKNTPRAYFTTKIPELSTETRAEHRENIAKRLSDYGLTQVWLIARLAVKGINTNKSEMSSILHGTRIGSKVDAIMIMSLKILDDYARYFTDST